MIKAAGEGGLGLHHLADCGARDGEDFDVTIGDQRGAGPEAIDERHLAEGLPGPARAHELGVLGAVDVARHADLALRHDVKRLDLGTFLDDDIAEPEGQAPGLFEEVVPLFGLQCREDAVQDGIGSHCPASPEKFIVN
ncbi:MAG: hypothetical protein QF639_02290 [Rhodospirillales bacterium]|nr:hypothetical protein [Rhodospirillales bacterium]